MRTEESTVIGPYMSPTTWLGLGLGLGLGSG